MANNLGIANPNMCGLKNAPFDPADPLNTSNCNPVLTTLEGRTAIPGFMVPGCYVPGSGDVNHPVAYFPITNTGFYFATKSPNLKDK